MDDSVSKQQVTLCDALDRILSSGIVAHGDIVISVADVDLLRISLRALVAATDALCDDLCQEPRQAAAEGAGRG